MDERQRLQFMLDELAFQMAEVQRSVDRADDYATFRKLSVQYAYLKSRIEMEEAVHRLRLSPIAVTYG